MPKADLGDIELHFNSFGSGPPVLGIMGFGLDSRYWAAQVPAIAERNRFITFDNRGSGRSSRIDATSIDEMANDAVRLLDHLEIDRAVIFGASMGGAIAQRLILDHPDRVSAAIFAITFARPIEYMRRQTEVARRLIERGGVDEFIEATLLFMFSPRFFEMGAEAVDQMMRAFDAPGGPEPMSAAGLQGQIDAVTKHDTLAELHRIEVPTLVIGGKNDIMVPGFASEEIAAAIPGAQLEMFDSGHGLMFECLDEFNSTVRTFLDGLKADIRPTAPLLS